MPAYSRHKRPPLPRSTAATTSLAMVFDFFKKAQTDAAEQLSAFATGLAKSRNQFLYNLEEIGTGGNLLDRLEETLLQADLGLATTDDVLEEARFLREEGTEIFGQDDVRALLRGKLLEALGAGNGARETSRYGLRFAAAGDPQPLAAPANARPLTVHLVLGANGMGKTTTIGKLAHRLQAEAGQKVLVAACDTFRAGAVAQLEGWATRADVDCFSPVSDTNGPSAVLYGALDRALAGGYDVLLVDTSGRLSNNAALTAELVKMRRVIQKRLATEVDEDGRPMPNTRVPHETLLVLDAAQGRMALDSARRWEQEVGLTGLVLTKLDGSAKGGSVVAVSRELGLPVKLVGVGEGMKDLRDFEPESFVDGLLGIGVAGGGTSKAEGKALATRLTQMRTERNRRANTKVAITVKENAVPMQAGGPAGQMTLQGLDDGAGGDGLEALDANGKKRKPSRGNNKSRNKKKKKKKGKR